MNDWLAPGEREELRAYNERTYKARHGHCITQIDALKQEIEQLRGTLSLAEEGLANYVQDFQRLTEILQACLAAMRIAQENNGRGVGTDWSLMMVAISAALRLEPTSEKQP